MFHSTLARNAVNIGLRGLSLAAKLVLTLYMGRYLGLSELGVYGLVFSAVSIAAVILGGKLDFVVARDLVGETKRGAVAQMRDQFVFYGFYYILFVMFIGLLWLLGAVTPLVLLNVLSLSILESLAYVTSTNLIAMGRPTLANFLFFIRAGSWCLIVSALGIFVPETRTVETVLLAWTIGVSASLFLTGLAWGRLPWGELRRIPIDWSRMKKGALITFPIWIGTICGSAAIYLERFVVSFYLDLEKVGIITFFASFSLALLSLVQSGFFALSYPRLIEHHKNGRGDLFWSEARRTFWHVSLFVFVAVIATGYAVPLLGKILGKTEIAAETTTLWLMLWAVWVRGNADSFYYILYARHQDWANWVGHLLFLIPSLVGNLVLIPLCGLEGVGLSSMLAAFFLLFWRLYFVLHPERKIFSRN